MKSDKYWLVSYKCIQYLLKKELLLIPFYLKFPVALKASTKLVTVPSAFLAKTVWNPCASAGTKLIISEIPLSLPYELNFLVLSACPQLVLISF